MYLTSTGKMGLVDSSQHRCLLLIVDLHQARIGLIASISTHSELVGVFLTFTLTFNFKTAEGDATERSLTNIAAHTFAGVGGILTIVLPTQIKEHLYQPTLFHSKFH